MTKTTKSTTEMEMMPAKIGLETESRECVAAMLDKTLADEHVLYVKTRKYHWNVTGPTFRSLHKLFEEQYTELALAIDELAERSLKIGAKVPGTMTEYLKLARLKEEPGDNLSAEEMVASLRDDHEAIIRQLRQDIDACADKYSDAGTADFLTGLMELHEKFAWMLRATL